MILTHIQNAWDMVNKIPVKGDSVDLLAIVRNELRLAYQEAEAEENAKKEQAEREEDIHG